MQRQEFTVNNLVFNGADGAPYTGRVRFVNMSRGRGGSRPGGNLVFVPINDRGQATDIKGVVTPQGQRWQTYTIPADKIDDVFGGPALALGPAGDPWRDIP